MQVSINEHDINPFHTVTLPGLTMHYGLKYTDFIFQTLGVKEIIYLLGKIVGGGIGIIFGDRVVKWDENKKPCILIRIFHLVGQWVSLHFMMWLNLIKTFKKKIK